MINKLLIHCIITLILNAIWIYSSSYPGGDVGMIPFQTAIIVFVLLIISSALVFLNNKFFQYDFIVILFVHLVIFELIFLYFEGKIPILNIFKDGLDGFIAKGYSFSSIIAGIIVIIWDKFFSRG